MPKIIVQCKKDEQNDLINNLVELAVIKNIDINNFIKDGVLEVKNLIDKIKTST